MSTFNEIRTLIEMSDVIAISGHTSPDGDAIGSCCALAMALKELGKETAVIIDEFPDVFHIIPTGGLLYHSLPEGFAPDLYIALDCGDIERLGKNKELFSEAPNTINIDHHRSNTEFGKLNYVDEDASSTSEIIFKLLYGYAPFNNDIASALYTGIIYDTGGFRHSSTTPATMAIAAELMEYDFNFSDIYNKVFFTRKMGEAKALGLAMERLERCLNGKGVYTYITLEDMKRLGVGSDDLHEITGFIKGIEGCEVSAFVYEKTPNAFKVSMRSDESFDVCKICGAFGGGGHIRAAGCTVEGNPMDIVEKVFKEAEKQL